MVQQKDNQNPQKDTKGQMPPAGNPPQPPAGQMPPTGNPPQPPAGQMPPAGNPPQPPAGQMPPGGYPPQGAYPYGMYPQYPPAGYPPMDMGAYNMPQGGYPPQGGYYPPQGGGYPPQMGGQMPPGGSYPPQGGGYPPMGGYPPAGGPLPPGGAYPPQEDTTPANFQLGTKLPAKLKVKAPKNNLKFDEEYFIRLLAGSISLSKDEKKKIVESIPKLKQSQIDELVRIFEEERQKFAALSKKHVPQLEKLAVQHFNEWMDLENESQLSQKKEEDTSKAEEIRKKLGI